MPARRLAASLALVGVALAGCGDATPLSERDDDSLVVVRMDEADGAVAPSAGTTEEPGEVPAFRSSAEQAAPRGVADGFAVLFDEPWLVVEGVWYLGAAETVPSLPGGSEDLLTLGADGRSVWISGPAAYGEHDLRVERHPARPPVPGWCEDLAEVSMRHSDTELQMGSFETFSDGWAAPRGDLRVRYCAAGQDRAAAETADDEFDGDGYRLYSSRHLVQVWAAPVAPPLVRPRSDFARSLQD